MKKTYMNSNTLPRWNLNDLYSSKDSLELQGDFEVLENAASNFSDKYLKKIDTLSANDLLTLVKKYEEIQELANKISGFAFLLRSVNVDDAEISSFYQNTLEKLNGINTKLLFLNIEICDLPDSKLNDFLKQSQELKKYENWFRSIRLFKRHKLSLLEENILNSKVIASKYNWVRLFDETIAGLRFEIGGKQYDLHGAGDLLSNREESVRKDASEAITKGLKEKANVLTLITNTLSQDKMSEDNLRKYPQPISERNLSNQVQDEVVSTLIDTVKSYYPKLSHKYYKIKAKLFGRNALNHWDRNAPYPQCEEKLYSFEEAKNIILESYKDFSPKLAELGEEFFQKNWIDVPAEPSKMVGAFCHPVSSKIHPYVMVNFQGKTRDVSTLSHELGHGIHFLLSQKQGDLLFTAPLTICETASVFGEQLTFRKILKDVPEEQRKYMIAGKVEDMLNTVVRQIAFCDFEVKLHNARKQGELSTQQINQIFLETQKETFGTSVILPEDYGYLWSYVPHFIHSPFYVYAYAFGDCLVNSLYSVYTNREVEGFEQKYFEFLSLGGSLPYEKMLSIFDFKPNRDFWQKGLTMIEDLIEQI